MSSEPELELRPLSVEKPLSHQQHLTLRALDDHPQAIQPKLVEKKHQERVLTAPVRLSDIKTVVSSPATSSPSD